MIKTRGRLDKTFKVIRLCLEDWSRTLSWHLFLVPLKFCDSCWMESGSFKNAN